MEGVKNDIWQSPPAKTDARASMNRSASEWAFQRFLQQAAQSDGVEEVESQEAKHNAGSRPHSPTGKGESALSFGGTSALSFEATPPSAAPASKNIPTDSEEYHAFLKNQLYLACAAMASSRTPFVNHQDPSAKADCGSQISNASQLSSQASSKGHGCGLTRSQDTDASGHSSLPSSATTQKKSVVVIRSNSISSRDLSDDDEADGETETTTNTDPAYAKRVRRMLSNRESARRSRRRKQVHMTELETQVSQLRVENSSLLKQLSEITHNYNEAAVNNRVLKADIETMRAKVKMAEETVKRITGFNPMLQSMSDVLIMRVQSPDASTDAAVPLQDNENHKLCNSFQNVSPDNHNVQIDDSEISPPETAVPNSGEEKKGRKLMQRVASLERLQKRIRGDLTTE